MGWKKIGADWWATTDRQFPAINICQDSSGLVFVGSQLPLTIKLCKQVALCMMWTKSTFPPPFRNNNISNIWQYLGKGGLSCEEARSASIFGISRPSGLSVFFLWVGLGAEVSFFFYLCFSVSLPCGSLS